MKKENQKHSVISLNDESFKHYLIQKYSDEPATDSSSTDAWIELFNYAKLEMEKNGGRITGFEVIDDVLVSHENVNKQWPANWMWVLQFNND